MNAVATRVLRRASSIALTVGAGVGVLVLLGVVAGALFAVRPVVITSGSMEPEIGTGALVLTRPVAADAVRVGDVVTVPTTTGTRVTHRVVSAEPRGEAVLLRLKGDANSAPDAETYAVTDAHRVVAELPWLGYLLSALRSPFGIFVLGGLAALLVAFLVRGGNPPGDGDPPRPGRLRGARRAAASVTTGTALLAVAVAPSSAAWTDDVAVNGTVLTAHTVGSQVQPGCQNVDGILVLGNIARLTWTQVDSRYEYAWELRNTGGAVVASGTVGAGTATGATVTLDLGTALIGVNANYNLVLRARLAAPPSTWVAATTTTTPVRRASILIIGAAMRCGHA